MKTLDIIQGFCDHVFRDKKGNRIFPNIFVGKWEADLLEVTRSRLTYEYEVKVSRCDFHKDKKKSDKYGKNKFDVVTSGQRTNYFYYIVPKSLIKPDEVPDFAGLIYAYEGSVQCYSLENILIMGKLNEIAQKAYECAVRRGKIDPDNDSNNNLHRDLLEEVAEVFECTGEKSPHIKEYLDVEEELADVIIVALSTLHHFKCDIDSLIEAKMNYNKNRMD